MQHAFKSAVSIIQSYRADKLNLGNGNEGSVVLALRKGIESLVKIVVAI